MSLTNEHVGPMILAKIKIYVFTRVELLFQVCYETPCSSKSHCENSISFIFLKSPHQVDMKIVVKSSKHLFGYINTLETHSDLKRKWK